MDQNSEQAPLKVTSHHLTDLPNSTFRSDMMSLLVVDCELQASKMCAYTQNCSEIPVRFIMVTCNYAIYRK